MSASAVVSWEQEARPAPSPSPCDSGATVRPRSVVVYSVAALTSELYGTVLASGDVYRRTARSASEAIAMMLSARPDLLVVDEASPDADILVGAVRTNPVTRPVSIVVVAAGDFDPRDLRFITAGANAILRLPAGPEWDERLAPLLYVPPRRDTRLAVLVQYQTALYGEVHTVAGTALNVSESGMLLETDVELPVGIDVDFRIHLAADGGMTAVVGCGQLVRQDARRSGVRFYGLEHDGALRLRRYVLG